MFDDVEILLDTKGGFNGRPVSPLGMLRLMTRMDAAVDRTMDEIGTVMLQMLIRGYQAAIRVEPRERGGELARKLVQCMKYKVESNRGEITVNIFELAKMSRLTMNAGFGTGRVGWFMFYEDGHIGRGHGSDDWAFVEIDEAKQHAERAISMLKLPGAEADRFRGYVARKFRGRHGDGIMVRTDRPMFFKYPQYGSSVPGDASTSRAANVLGRTGHKGFYAWNVLRNVGGLMHPRGRKNANNDMVAQMVMDGIDKVVKEELGGI
jgi:hypothetical protein